MPEEVTDAIRAIRATPEWAEAWGEEYKYSAQPPSAELVAQAAEIYHGLEYWGCLDYSGGPLLEDPFGMATEMAHAVLKLANRPNPPANEILPTRAEAAAAGTIFPAGQRGPTAQGNPTAEEIALLVKAIKDAS